MAVWSSSQLSALSSQIKRVREETHNPMHHSMLPKKYDLTRRRDDQPADLAALTLHLDQVDSLLLLLHLTSSSHPLQFRPRTRFIHHPYGARFEQGGFQIVDEVFGVCREVRARLALE